MTEKSEICTFYNGQNVFITGVTGFVGHVLVEKLLRTTDVATIYVLIREKKGYGIQSRLDYIFNSPVFDVLKNQRPQFRKRVVPISGDCSLKGLGLTAEDRQKLVAKTNVVFHAAATVRLDENLKIAYNINVRGTSEILDLCKEMKGFKSLVQVSTAFSNCYLKTIEEKIYEMPVTTEEVEALLENATEEEAKEMTPKLIKYWPNTYTFTKALAELLVREKSGDLPVGIFRPSIIISTYKEPIEGWINNVYGPTGAVAASAYGLVHVYPCDNNLVSDLVPVDPCVAGIIAAAWDVANIAKSTNTPVYNYVSSVENAITWGDYNALNCLHGIQYPTNKAVYKFVLYHVPWGPKYFVLRTLLHQIPAMLLDAMLVLTGRKPKFMALFDKIHKFSAATASFSDKEWTFKNDNVVALWDKMNKTDQKLFPVSIKTVSWTMYFRDHFKWMRVYLLKDPLTTVDAALVRKRNFDILHFSLKFLGIFIVVTLIWIVILKVAGAFK